MWPICHWGTPRIVSGEIGRQSGIISLSKPGDARSGEAGLTRHVVIGLLTIALSAGAAWADDDDASLGQNKRPQNQSAAVNFQQAVGADEIDGPSIFEGVPALNPLDAARDTLRDRYGIYFHGDYTGDPYANLSGGLKPGSTYSGRLNVELDLDARKTIGLAGGTLHANMFQSHGLDLSSRYVGNFLTSNDIAVDEPATRLYELWYEQRLGDKLSLRVGQQGIDVEMMTSSYAANFIDATFGWPGLPTENLPDGAAAYPLATPAVRLRYEPSKGVAILAAVFDGAPAGPCAGEPQQCDPHGTNFRISDPPLAILEAQVRYNQGADASGLPGRVKLGAFEQFGHFDDQRYGADDFNVALGLNSVLHAPDGGLYAIVDQQVFRLPGSGDKANDADATDDDRQEKGVGIFARAIGAPSTRNPVDVYVDGGISALGLVPGRPDDLVGMAAAVAKISSPTSGLDDPAKVASGLTPARSFEAVIEATYQAQIVPGLTVQPTFQYIVHPGGNVADPYGNGIAAIPNAKVLGVTTTVHF